MKRRTHKKDLSGLYFLLATMAVGGLFWLYGEFPHKAEAQDMISPLASIQPEQISVPESTTRPRSEVVIDEMYAKYKTDRVIIEKIVKAWGPVVGVEAVKVSFCESSHNPFIEHTESSAKGLFQILRGTWNGYKCEGSPLNADDNISCAYKIYQSNGWGISASWGASQHCHGYK